MNDHKDVLQDPPMNFSELLARVDNDRELLRDLLTIFKDEFPNHLQDLRSAVEQSDPKQVAKISHALKGMLANLAATRSTSLVAELEALARQNQVAGLKEALALFEREIQRLLPQMDGYMAEVAS